MLAQEHLKAVEAFAQAGVDQDAWLPALASLASLTRSRYGELIGIRGDDVSFCVSEVPEAGRHEFIAAGAYDPGVNPRVAVSAAAAPMQVAGDCEYDAAAPSLRIQPFMDLVRKFDIPHGCQTTLHHDKGASVFDVTYQRTQ